MTAFWNRIHADTAAGTIFDGERRYLMMRPDVLMGMLRELPEDTRSAVLAALAESTRVHGGKSVSAYQSTGGQALLQQTVIDGAAAFGWGTWRITSRSHEAELEVENSPFAAGYGRSDLPVCAPINGMFHSLAQALMGAAVEVRETHCAAQHGGRCRFIAQRAGHAGPSVAT
jgi:hypothetical protein